MCRECKLREMHDVTDWEATTILRVLIERAHAVRPGVLEIELNETEADWLAEWEAEQADLEESEHAEDDGSPEGSEQLETDCRTRLGPGETATAIANPNGMDSAIETYRSA